MARTKSASDLDAKLTRALERYYGQLATFLNAIEFADILGADLRKAEVARMALESRTRSSIGPEDRLEAFYKQFLEGEEDVAIHQTLEGIGGTGVSESEQASDADLARLALPDTDVGVENALELLLSSESVAEDALGDAKAPHDADADEKEDTHADLRSTRAKTAEKHATQSKLAQKSRKSRKTRPKVAQQRPTAKTPPKGRWSRLP